MTEKANSIDEFLDYFTEHIKAIKGLQEHDTPRHYRKILYVSVLDAMSKAAYPHSKHRERFFNILRDYSGWENGSKVSLPYLAALLSIVPDPMFQPLREFVAKGISTWVPGRYAFLDKDPSFDEVADLWPIDTKYKEYREPHSGISLKDLRHWNLFYSYRNTLIHEFRPPSIQIEIESDNQPYYYMHGMLSPEVQSINSPWYLAYPEGHFLTICNTTVKRLADYFHRNDIDPVQFYVSGIYILKELNI